MAYDTDLNPKEERRWLIASLIVLLVVLVNMCAGAQDPDPPIYDLVEDYTEYFDGFNDKGDPVQIEVGEFTIEEQIGQASSLTLLVQDSTYQEYQAREYIGMAGDYTVNWIFYFNDYYTYQVSKVLRCWCHCHEGAIIGRSEYLAKD